MIVVRSPLRLSLGGGGTDLPSYYQKRGGYLIAAAIDQYVYVAFHKTYDGSWILKYSENEVCSSISTIKHPIIREVLKNHARHLPGLEITSFADIPGGTGLGSSSAFTAAMVKGCFELCGSSLDAEGLAVSACEIELDKLGEPIGKQDQYITAYGGVNEFTFDSDDSVHVDPLYETHEDTKNLADNFLLVYTGKTRRASKILQEQKSKTENVDEAMISNLDRVKELGYEFGELLRSGDFRQYGKLMGEHWRLKKERSPNMTNEVIDELYDFGLRNGASGGKLVGAGGGGFLLFQTDKKVSWRDFNGAGCKSG